MKVFLQYKTLEFLGREENVMKRKSIFTVLIQGSLISLLVLGICLATNAQPINKKYSKVLSKLENVLKSSQINFNGGKLIVGGEVRQVDVSGGKDGCYTMTVKVYKIAPNGERILARTRSKKVCALIDTPRLVFEDIPRSKIVVEVEIDKPRWADEKFRAEINVTYPAETLNR